MAARLDTPFLGRLPLDPDIAAICDAGQIEDYPAEAFTPIAEQIIALAAPARPPALPVKP
jgi:hypothetical protein